MEFLEKESGRLRNLYWQIRATRRPSERRRFYRQVRIEKGRLAALGIDQELIRLYCLHLADPHRENRLKRLQEEGRKLRQACLDFGP